MSAESDVDAVQKLASKLSTIISDKKDKQRRLETLRTEFSRDRYDDHLSEKMSKSRAMEAERDGLNIELRALSAQADTRAKLDLKRAELKSKTSQMRNTYVHALYSFDHGIIQSG